MKMKIYFNQIKNYLKCNSYLYVFVIRYYRSITYNRSGCKLKNKNPFSMIYKENLWECKESVSGWGSTFVSTTSLRKYLPAIFEKYHIDSILDIPCGDYNWMKYVDKGNLKYIGADIVEELIEINKTKYPGIDFRVIDLTKDELPQVDLIFCKDCLQHLSYQNIFLAIENIKRSKSKYLLTTSYPLTIRNCDINTGDCYSMNLHRKPFYFPKHIDKIKEPLRIAGNEIDKTMYLWEIDKL